MPDFFYEQRVSGACAGVDEVGRGPLAGPVIAAACVFKTYDIPSSLADHIQDSKKLTAKRRLLVRDQLIPYVHIAWGGASVGEIDTLNIHQATLLAMARAVEKLPLVPQGALVDGKFAPNWSLPTTCLVNGDSLSLSIAAASIFAKMIRDDVMKILGKRYPGYGWESNMGYGSAKHLEGISTQGVTRHHRMSFAPCRGL